MHELTEAKATLSAVVLILRRQANGAWADRLQSALDAMNGWYATKEQLYAIGELCHPKGLGDILVGGMSNEEWWSKVVDLHDKCARAFNALERLQPSERETAVK